MERKRRNALPDGLRYRATTQRDATILATLVAEGFATYREFAPPGWQPRPAYQEEAELSDRLGRGDVHGRLALTEDGAAAGFATWSPAVARDARPDRIPGRAHVSGLFVARPWWGSGLAAELLAWAVDGMRDSGFSEAQLWTPRDHARARAFYEREGWRPGADRTYSPELALDLVLYERPLG